MVKMNGYYTFMFVTLMLYIWFSKENFNKLSKVYAVYRQYSKVQENGIH